MNCLQTNLYFFQHLQTKLLLYCSHQKSFGAHQKYSQMWICWIYRTLWTRYSRGLAPDRQLWQLCEVAVPKRLDMPEMSSHRLHLLLLLKNPGVGFCGKQFLLWSSTTIWFIFYINLFILYDHNVYVDIFTDWMLLFLCSNKLSLFSSGVPNVPSMLPVLLVFSVWVSENWWCTKILFISSTIPLLVWIWVGCNCCYLEIVTNVCFAVLTVCMLQ